MSLRLQVDLPGLPNLKNNTMPLRLSIVSQAQPETEHNIEPPLARQRRGMLRQPAVPVGGDRGPPTTTSSKLPAAAETATSCTAPDTGSLAANTTRRKRSASDAFLGSANVMVVRVAGTCSGASHSPTVPAAQPEATNADHSHWCFAGGSAAASQSGINRPSHSQWHSGATAEIGGCSRSPQQLNPSMSFQAELATTTGLISPPAEQPSAQDAATVTVGPTSLLKPTLSDRHLDEREGGAQLRQPKGTTAAEPPQAALVASQAAGRNKNSASASPLLAGGRSHHAASTAAVTDAIQVQVGDAAEQAPGALPMLPSPYALPGAAAAAALAAPVAEAEEQVSKGGGPQHSREVSSSVPHGLWRISAGPLSFLPAVGSLVVYCTDGHLQQMQSGGAAVAGAAAAPADRRVSSSWQQVILVRFT